LRSFAWSFRRSICRRLREIKHRKKCEKDRAGEMSFSARSLHRRIAAFAGIWLLTDQKAVFGSQGGLVQGAVANAPTRGARTQPTSAERSAGTVLA
jgi:hypothetical protein